MPSFLDRFKTAVEDTETLTGKYNEWVNGADDATVDTDSGSVPTIAKATKDFQDAVDPNTLTGQLGSRETSNAMVLRDQGVVETQDRPELRPGFSSFWAACWFRSMNPAATTLGGMLSKGKQTSTWPPGGIWQMGYWPAEQRLQFTVRTDEGGVSEASVLTTVSLEELQHWNHFVAVRDAENGKLFLYRNGLEVDSTEIVPINVNSTLPFCIGRSSSGETNEFVNGDYKDVVYGCGAPTADEVMEMYRGGLPYRYRRGEFVQNTNTIFDGGVTTSGGSNFTPTGFDGVMTFLSAHNGGISTRPTFAVAPGDVITMSFTVSDFALISDDDFIARLAPNDFAGTDTLGVIIAATGNGSNIASGNRRRISGNGDHSVTYRVTTASSVARFVIGAYTGTEAEANISDIQVTINGAVLHYPGSTIGQDPGLWRNAAPGNPYHGLISTSGAAPLRLMDRDIQPFRGVNATGGAYLGRSGDMAREGTEVRRVRLENRGSAEAADLVIQYSDGSSHTDMFTPVTLAAGAAVYVDVTVSKPAGRNRYRITGSAGVGNLDIDLYRNLR